MLYNYKYVFLTLICLTSKVIGEEVSDHYYLPFLQFSNNAQIYCLDAEGSPKLSKFMEGLDKPRTDLPVPLIPKQIWKVRRKSKSGEIVSFELIMVAHQMNYLGDKYLSKEGWIYILELFLMHSDKLDKEQIKKIQTWMKDNPKQLKVKK